MKTTKTFNHSCAVLLACLILAACASKPVLIPKSPVVPAGVDFSGQWQLRLEPGASPFSGIGAEPPIRISSKKRMRNEGGRRSTRSSGSSVQLFLETGESLKISQTGDGLFISFDRAIVEEYRFGENRVVSVGPVNAQRVSGWQEGSFVVETLDAEGAVLTESWRLDEDGDVLVRDVSLADGDATKFSSQQRFDRS